MQSAVQLRRMADQAVQQGRFADAVRHYRAEAAIYRRNGDLDGARVEEAKANRYDSSVRLFAHLERPASTRPAAPLAKWEPPYGCYVGAFIDRDERLGAAFTDENSQTHQDPEAFARLVDKRHASVFCYLSYGRPFPSRWVERLRRQGVVPHIAFEPTRGLDAVRDDDYLRRFADDCARADCPIFLRYASEMNGDWTRYGGDANAAAYVEKWRLVHSVVSRRAPNVAMIWCVNVVPEKNIARFYPGDPFVDWVGINFYAVPFYDNDPSRPGLADNPADNLAGVYRAYAAKKPIAICEFGASHLSKADGKDRSEWAARKIHELYASLPRLWPRVKLVDIFDMDNTIHAQAGRQLNNYSVTDSDTVREAYADAVAPEYFLGRVGAAATPSTIAPVPASGLTVPRGTLTLSAWARCWAERFSVRYTVDGREVARADRPGPREVQVPLGSTGTLRIGAQVVDPKGKVAARTEAKVTVA